MFRFWWGKLARKHSEQPSVHYTIIFKWRSKKQDRLAWTGYIEEAGRCRYGSQPSGSMEQSTLWAANSSSVSQETPSRLQNLMIHCHVHNRSYLFLFKSKSIQSTTYPISRYILISSHLRLGLPLKLVCTLLFPYAPHAPPISLHSIWSAEKHKATKFGFWSYVQFGQRLGCTRAFVTKYIQSRPHAQRG